MLVHELIEQGNLWLCATDSTQYHSNGICNIGGICLFFSIITCICVCSAWNKRWDQAQCWQILSFQQCSTSQISLLCSLCALCCVLFYVRSVFFPWVRPSNIIQFHFSLHIVFALTRSNLSAALKHNIKIQQNKNKKNNQIF